MNSNSGNFGGLCRASLDRTAEGGRPHMVSGGLGRCPNSGQPRYARGRNSKIGTGADQHLFQAADVVHRAQVLAVALPGWKPAQIENRISDSLSRPVEGHVSAAIAL